MMQHPKLIFIPCLFHLETDTLYATDIFIEQRFQFAVMTQQEMELDKDLWMANEEFAQKFKIKAK